MMDRRTGSRASRAPRFSPSRFELRRRWGPQLNFDLATTTGHTVFIEQAPRIYTTAGVLAFVCGHGNPRAEGSFTLDAKGPTKSLLEIGSQITSRINPLSVFKGAAGKLRRMRGPSTSKKKWLLTSPHFLAGGKVGTKWGVKAGASEYLKMRFSVPAAGISSSHKESTSAWPLEHSQKKIRKKEKRHCTSFGPCLFYKTRAPTKRF